MDQPAGLVPKMTKLGNIHSAMQAYRKCEKSLTEVKERYGKQVYRHIVKILKVTRGHDE